MKPAIFLDRDGTICHDIGLIKTFDSIQWIDGVVESLKKLSDKFNLFIITNQPYFNNKMLLDVEYLFLNRAILRFFSSHEIFIKEIFTCTHDTSELCLCRKPSPYFIFKADFIYEIDLENSWVIGDHPHDIYMARSANLKSVYVLTGHGLKHLSELLITSSTYIQDDINGAAKFILSRK